MKKTLLVVIAITSYAIVFGQSAQKWPPLCFSDKTFKSFQFTVFCNPISVASVPPHTDTIPKKYSSVLTTNQALAAWNRIWDKNAKELDTTLLRNGLNVIHSYENESAVVVYNSRNDKWYLKKMKNSKIEAKAQFLPVRFYDPS